MASEDADFTDEFCRFLQEVLPTVEAAELLLLAHAPERAFSAAEAVAALGSGYDEAQVRRQLEAFRARDLLVEQPDGRALYRPATQALVAHAHTLDKVYRERPVTLIRVIYGLRDSKIRSFADAFKLQRK